MRRIKVLPFKAGLLDLQINYFNKMASKGYYFYKKEGIFYYFKDEKVCDYYSYTQDQTQAKKYQIITSNNHKYYYLGMSHDQQLDKDYSKLTETQANKSVKVYWLFIFLTLSPMIISYMLMLMSHSPIITRFGALLQMFGIIYYALMIPYLVNMIRNLLIMMKKGEMETPFTQRYQLVIDDIDQIDIRSFQEFKNWNMRINQHRVLASFESDKNADALKLYIASQLNIDQKKIHITGATDYFFASLAV